MTITSDTSHPSWWIPAQEDREELLDLGAGTAAERRRSLADLRRVNRWAGGIAASRRELARFLERTHLRELTLLDLGTGTADVPASLARWAQSRGVRLHAIGLDLKREHLLAARAELDRAGERAALIQADAFRLPFADASIEVVHSSLFLHHFRPPALCALLQEALRVARRLVLMNDLVRHRVPLLFLRAAAPLIARSRITRHDGRASILRAYTPGELSAIAAAAGLERSAVRTHFPYRHCLVVEKTDGHAG